MSSKALIDAFLAEPALAVVGVSRSGKGFGNAAARELRRKGYRVYPVNPQADLVDGERCYRSLAGLPERVGAVLIVVPAGQGLASSIRRQRPASTGSGCSRARSRRGHRGVC